MKIIKGLTYTTEGSPLAFRVLDIYARNEERILCKLMLFNKESGLIYEEKRRYRLYFKKLNKLKIYFEKRSDDENKSNDVSITPTGVSCPYNIFSDPSFG